MALIADYLDRMIVNTILVVLDGSPEASRSARSAVGFALDNVSKVVVLALCSANDAPNGGQATSQGEAQRSANVIREFANTVRIPCELHVLSRGRPAEQIVAEATRRHCDLIWMPGRGAKHDGGNVLDASVVLEVMENVDVPVLLFRSQSGG